MSRQPENITTHMQKLLDILRSLYGWSSRATITEKLGRKQFNNYDAFTLEKLTARGLVETRKVKSGGRRGHSLEYRFIEPEERDTDTA